MSTPALNPRPSARSTSARTDGSAPSAVITSASSNQPATVSALTGGLSMTTSAIPSLMVCVIGMRLPWSCGLVRSGSDLAPNLMGRQILTQVRSATGSRPTRPGRSGEDGVGVEPVELAAGRPARREQPLDPDQAADVAGV